MAERRSTFQYHSVDTDAIIAETYPDGSTTDFFHRTESKRTFSLFLLSPLNVIL